MYLPAIKLLPVLRGMWRGAGEDRLEGAARARGIKAKSTEKRMMMALKGCGTSSSVMEKGVPVVYFARAEFRPLQRQHLDYLTSRQSREPLQGSKALRAIGLLGLISTFRTGKFAIFTHQKRLIRPARLSAMSLGVTAILRCSFNSQGWSAAA